MNTQAQVHRLEAGQALPPSRGSRGPAVLAEGELLVQAPAQWLADRVVLPPPVRLIAPAVLECTPSFSVVAVRASTVVQPEAVTRLPMGRWLASVAYLLVPLRRRIGG